jgi:hypothetical protein
VRTRERDEIGRLADRFSLMAQRLRDNVREIQDNGAGSGFKSAPRLHSESGTSIVSAIPGSASCLPLVPVLGRHVSSASTHWCPPPGSTAFVSGGRGRIGVPGLAGDRGIGAHAESSKVRE